MPATSARQRRFMGAELARKRAGKQTRTGMSESQLEDFAMKKHMKGMKSHMPKGAGLSPSGDIGEKRGQEATRAIRAFKGDGKVMSASSYFGSNITPRASKEGNSPR